MKANFTRWTNPILGQDADEFYTNIYEGNGKEIVRMLETAPYEIAVISRLLTYLQNKKNEEA